MLGLQIKAFSLLVIVLFIVDAAAFQGQYRELAGQKIGHFLSGVSPAHWHGLGRGRDWSAPGPSPR